jgi:TonB family protein
MRVLFIMLALALPVPVLSGEYAYTFAKDISNEKFEFPYDVLFRGKEGWVLVSYDIAPDGKTENIVIHASNGVSQLNHYVTRYIERRSYEPAVLNGTPVKQIVEPIVFSAIISNKKPEVSKVMLRDFKSARKHLRNANFEEARDALDTMSNRNGRNFYEQAQIHRLYAELYRLTGDDLRELERLITMMRMDEEDALKYSYFSKKERLSILRRIYEIETSNMRLSDAIGTVDWMKKVDADAGLTREIVAHSHKIREFLAQGKAFSMKTKLVPTAYGGPAASKLAVTRKRILLGSVKGEIDSVMLGCDKGMMVLDYTTKAPWEIPANWHSCRIRLTGQADTTVELTELPN